MLFWNLNDRPALVEQLVNGFVAGDYDVLVVAEAANVVGLVELSASRGVSVVEEGGPDGGMAAQAIRLFYRPGERRCVLVRNEGPRCRVFRVEELGDELLLFVVHLRSALHADDADQDLGCRDVVDRIVEIERERGVATTLVVGDFNLDPYDGGLREADAFHAFMSADSLADEGRQVGGRQRRGFYNPMWSLFGDRSDGPPGTYFRRGGAASTDWQMFDQVLVRPSMASKLRDVEIVQHLGGHRLACPRGRPEASDHFPIRFQYQLAGVP